MSEQIEEIDDFEFSIDGIEESNDVFNMDFDESVVGKTSTEETTEEVDNKEKETFNAEDVFEVDEKGNNVTAGKEEETVTGDTPSTIDKGSSSSKDVYSKFASALYQDGILAGISEDDLKDVGDADKFADLIAKTIKANEYADLGERGKEFLEAVRAGVPIEMATKIHNTEIQLDNLKEESFIESDEDEEEVADSKRATREQLIYNDFLSKGMKESVAKRLTAASFKEGADEEDAKNAVENLRNTIKQTKAAKIEAAKAEQIQIQEQRNAFVDKLIKTEEIIPGIKVPEKIRSKIAKNMTEPTGRDANGKLRNFVGDKRAENTEMFDTRLNYYIELGLFDEKPDLSIFGKQKMSSAVSQLEKELGNDIIYEGGQGTSLKGVAERENQARMLSLLDNMEF